MVKYVNRFVNLKLINKEIVVKKAHDATAWWLVDL